MPLERLLDGVNVAVWLAPSYVTVPDTPPLIVKVDVLIVVASIASLNVAVIALLIATSASPLAGIVELTVGGVVSVVIFATLLC